MPQGYIEISICFSQILKANIADVIFPKDSTLLQHEGNLLLCSPSEEAWETNNIHLIMKLVTNRHKISKKKNII